VSILGSVIHNAFLIYSALCYSAIYYCLSGCNIIFHVITNDMIFERKKNVLNVKYVFQFSQQKMLSKTFLILRRIQRDITNARTSSCKERVSLVTLSL